MNLFNKDQSSSLCRPQWGGTGATKWWRKNWVLLVIIKAVGWRSNLSRVLLCLILFMAVRVQGSTNLEPHRAKLKVTLVGSSIFFAIIYFPYLDSKHMVSSPIYLGLTFSSLSETKTYHFFINQNLFHVMKIASSKTNLFALRPIWTAYDRFGPFWFILDPFDPEVSE